MKYLEEYRDKEIAQKYLDKIHAAVTKSWSVMEICGGQTHSLVRNGIIDLLPSKVTMIHGPGCPVCVTPAELIDKAIEISQKTDCIMCSFGDMLRVPGNSQSLLKAKSEGADVRIVYSPLDAVQIANSNPKKNIVFFAVGFETTAPANALAVLQAHELGLKNFFMLGAHVLVPPAMEALLGDKDTKIDGFLAAGHVCTVMGTDEYLPIVQKYNIPIVVTGFEPVDLLHGLLKCLLQLENGEYKLENQYARVVTKAGNVHAQKLINEVFKVTDRNWRGIGIIPKSGLGIHPKYRDYDADLRFDLTKKTPIHKNNCIAGEILKGLKKPKECPLFGNSCSPENPLGAPMVSSEGACAAYFNYSN